MIREVTQGVIAHSVVLMHIYLLYSCLMITFLVYLYASTNVNAAHQAPGSSRSSSHTHLYIHIDHPFPLTITPLPLHLPPKSSKNPAAPSYYVSVSSRHIYTAQTESE